MSANLTGDGYLATRTTDAAMPVVCLARGELLETVSGVAYPIHVEAHATLLQAVRDVIGFTGSKEGCDDSECGACMMLLDGKPVNACSYLALQADGRDVTTVEGLAGSGGLSRLQAAFLEQGGVQCGFCTPGMLISATALLHSTSHPTEDEVRIALSGTSAAARATTASSRPCFG